MLVLIPPSAFSAGLPATVETNGFAFEHTHQSRPLPSLVTLLPRKLGKWALSSDDMSPSIDECSTFRFYDLINDNGQALLPAVAGQFHFAPPEIFLRRIPQKFMHFCAIEEFDRASERVSS